MGVPFDVAADFLDVCGPPGDPESPLTLVSVAHRDADTGTAAATDENVKALKRKSTKAAAPAGGGEVSAETTSFRLWASDLSSAPKARDRITDADGVAWNVQDVSTEGFGGFYVCDPCVKART